MNVSSNAAESALVIVASSDTDVPNRKLESTVHGRAKNSLTLLTTEEIVPSSAVRVHSKHFLSFGSVVNCTRETEQEWRVYVSVHRSLMVV